MAYDTSVHIRVSGVVQGVGFRYCVYREAGKRGLTGFVRNLLGGDVEIVAQGQEGMVNDFVTRVRIGPRSAEITRMTTEWDNHPAEIHESFEIL
jgi:acylphosphatase